MLDDKKKLELLLEMQQMQKHHIKKKNFIAHKKNEHYSYKGSDKELGRPGRCL